jgi:hypothetical protein
MAAPEQQSDDTLALSMLGVYAVYMATNYYRHNGQTTPTAGKNSLIQHIIQGCKGHNHLTTLVQDRWLASFINIRE